MDPFDEIYLTEEAARRAGIPIARAFGRAGLRVSRSLWHELGAIAGMAQAWYRTHRMWHQNHDSSTPSSAGRPWGPFGRRMHPVDDGSSAGDVQVHIGDYQGLAYGVRGLVGHDTFLGRGYVAHPMAHTVRDHGVRRALTNHLVERSPVITRSMTRAAKRAGELMESPRVQRTMQGIYHHTSVHFEGATTRSRARLSLRFHPYRAAAHAMGFGHLAHAIP